MLTRRKRPVSTSGTSIGILRAETRARRRGSSARANAPHRRIRAPASLQTPARDAATIRCVRATWLLYAWALVGCDVVFRIDRLSTSDADAGTSTNSMDGSNLHPCAFGTHDEDGDLYADACDVCPGIADDQADDDHDGVGNACDPSAATQNEIALFVSFAAGSQDWNIVSGSWTFDGESLIYGGSSVAAYGIAVYEGEMPDPPYVIEYHYTIDEVEPRASSLSAILDSDSTGEGLTCGYTRHESPLKDVVRSTYPAGGTGAELTMAAVMPGAYRTTAAYDRVGYLRCALAADDLSTGGAVSLDLPTPPVPGAFAFRSMVIPLHIHYLTVYR